MPPTPKRQEKAAVHGQKAVTQPAEHMRKSRTPAGFVPMPCETVARKTLETLPLERTTESDSKTPQKLSKRRLWNARLTDGTHCSQKNAETLPLEPTK